MRKHFLKILFFTVIFVAGTIFTHAEEEADMQIIVKDKDHVVFYLKLLNTKELADVCSLVEIDDRNNDYQLNPGVTQDDSEDLLYQPIYVFGSVASKDNRASWVTFDIYSTNNDSFTPQEVTVNSIPNDGKIYFLTQVFMDIGSPRQKISKKDTILNVKIKKIFHK